MAFTPYGNVDTEAGGQGQPFPAIPSAGNMQTDMATSNAILGYGRTYAPAQPDPMQYYFQLGQQLLQQQAAMQQSLAQSNGMPQGSLDLGNPMLTAGYDPTWLTQRLDAASANGAAIGGMGKNPGQGPVTRGRGTPEGDTSKLPYGGMSAGWDTPTTPSYSGLKGAGRLM